MSDTKRRKYGPWSQEDKNFIASNANTMSVDDIAERIDRDPESVSKYIRKTLGLRIESKGRTSTLSSGTDIENSLIWEELQKEFSNEELKVFIYHWNRIVIQFKEDVFPTEEMQIIDTIKLEIMMGRSLKSQKESLDNIQNLQKEINILKQTDGEEGKINRLEQLVISYKSAYELSDKQVNDLLARKSSMLKELKGTRDQRLKRIEDSKTTFTGWMSELLQNSSLRRELGTYIEKFKMATIAEEKRLSQPHKFADDQPDLPLLTPENITKLQEEENKWDNQQQ
jgi:hypothetical protein